MSHELESVVYWCDARSAGKAWIIIHQWQRESAQSAVTAGTVLQSADHEHWKLSAHSDTCRDRCRGTVSCHSGETKCKPNVNVLLGHCILAAWCCNASAAILWSKRDFMWSACLMSMHLCMCAWVEAFSVRLAVDCSLLLGHIACTECKDVAYYASFWAHIKIASCIIFRCLWLLEITRSCAIMAEPVDLSIGMWNGWS